MKYISIVIVLMILTACGSADLGGAHPERQIKTPGVPVHYIAAQGVYGIDLTINGQVVPDVALDTGSANLIVANKDFVEKGAALNSFTIQFASFTGAVSTYDSDIEIQGQTINYPVGVYTSGGLGSILGLGYKQQNVSGAMPLGDIVSDTQRFTLNLCPSNQQGSFISFGDMPAGMPEMHYTALTYSNYISVKPTAVNGIAYPTNAFTLLDSGTNSFLYLPTQITAGLVQQYPSIPPGFWSYGRAYITAEQAKVLQPLSFTFGDFTISIPVDKYTVTTDKGVAALIVPSFQAGSTKLSILSTVFMQNVVLAFDKRARTVGMAYNNTLCN